MSEEKDFELNTKADSKNDVNPYHYHDENLPFNITEIEKRISRSDKDYKSKALHIALDFVWLRKEWREGKIPDSIRSNTSFRKYVQEYAPYSYHYCYRLEKALYLIINYMEREYKISQDEIFRSKKHIAEVEHIFNSIGITKLKLLLLEHDEIERMKVLNKLIGDPYSFTTNDLRKRVGRKVPSKPVEKPVSNDKLSGRHLSMEDRLFSMFEHLICDTMSEEDLKNIIKKFGMSLLTEIKTKMYE